MLVADGDFICGSRFVFENRLFCNGILISSNFAGVLVLELSYRTRLSVEAKMFEVRLVPGLSTERL